LYFIDSNTHSPFIGFGLDGQPVYGTFVLKLPKGTYSIIVEEQEKAN
jgi:hypothetical protein